MIKQVQLRGISRTPSDRMTSDGGCAESLNVHLDTQETAPTPAPDISAITAEVFGLLPQAAQLPIVFIHKLPSGVKNYIGFKEGIGLRAYNNGAVSIGSGYVVSVPQGETLVSITSIGNTLIVWTDEGKAYYLLYKEGAYLFLGNEIPKPQIEVATLPYDEASNGTKYGWVNIASGLQTDDHEVWEKAKKESDTKHADLLETMSNLWDGTSLQVKSIISEGYFAAPFFIRFALRLYDGSYIHHSSPILCGGGFSEPWIQAVVPSTSVYPNYFWVSWKNLFKVCIKGGIASGWEDLVESIDFFASDPIYTPLYNSNFFAWSNTTRTFQVYSGGTPTSFLAYDMIFEGMQDERKDTTIKEQILSKGNFYKVKSILISDTVEMTNLSLGAMRIEANEQNTGDYLMTQETLPDGYRTDSQYLPIVGSKTINNRVLLLGAKEKIGTGDIFLNGKQATAVSSVAPYVGKKFALRYKIVAESGDAYYVLARYRDGGDNLYDCYVRYPGGDTSAPILEYGNEDQLSSGDTYQRCMPYAWLAYPDTRCKEVEVSYYIGAAYRTVKIPMEPHPLLECAYAFLGFGYDISQLISRPDAYYGRETSENRDISQPNKIYQSAFENPWLFPAEGIITFADKVIDAAMTSVPLSEGQLGQFDVYAFTEGGIKVLSTARDGEFATSKTIPGIAEHVAIAGTITPLEQAIIFATKRGVMLLTGHQVTDLSQTMNGLPYKIDNALSAVLSSGSTPVSSALLQDASASETLMQFMEGAKIAYDHNGARLLFIRDGKRYYYEYRLETQTWHKGDFEKFLGSVNVLNSYPDCIISGETENTPYVANFTTFLDNASVLEDIVTNEVEGLIITRPLDLGAPDERKVIKDIRIRGAFNKSNVRYVLLGSFDGIEAIDQQGNKEHWKILTSLRGGSYKLFRLVIIAKLSPMERISWIDIDFETRLNNKLR